MTRRRTGESTAERIAAGSSASSLASDNWQVEARNWRKKAAQVERLVKLGTFELDPRTGALRWSDGLYSIFGLTPGSPITLDQAFGFYAPEDRKQIETIIASAKLTGEPVDFEAPFRSSTGQAGWLRAVAQIETVGGVPRIVGVCRDITQERDAEERLRRLANQDVLTGLPNRRAFQAHLEGALAGRMVHSLAVCLVDIDRFKTVNDVHGHAIGDRLLQEIAARLSQAVRAHDFVARLGGDEFVVVMHDMRGKADLMAKAAALVEAVRSPFAADGAVLHPTISIGICFDAVSPEAMIKHADVALYKAKLNGRDQACLFRPSFRKEINDHGRLLDEVRVGLARNQFEVHYQPIVDLRSQIVRGWEALVRWNHPHRGLLGPGHFMAALTDPKMSVAIDDFVLAASLRQMRQWLDGGVPVTCAGVNVSEAQLKRVDLVPTITALLDQNGLTPDRLKIEVLETAFIGHQTQAVAATIDRLARLGVVSALDDFGTGYASLTHLKQFRVERIKIDRSFVANLGVSDFDQAIVRCMITLGRDLGIRITAEGIETMEQLEVLRRLGCDCGQGYLFGRPMQPDDVPGFLTRWHGGESARLLGDVPGPPPLRLV